MSYAQVAALSNDRELADRIAACAAAEGVAHAGLNPRHWTADWMLVLASSPGWIEEEITDEMIAAQVRALKPFVMVAG